MSEYSFSSVEKRTRMLGKFAQVVTAIGFVVIVIGAIILITSLIQELASSLDRQWGEADVMDPISYMLSGLGLTALGSGLSALRTIAVNCARMADRIAAKE